MPVQSLVYIFIALAGLAVGATAYFGFTFSPIEAFVTAIGFVAIAVTLLERTLRHRAEARLERAVEDLSRLLATNAQAGTVLGQRINALVDEHAGQRLDNMEADVSVLGTVVRQVAEAVADLEEARKRQARRDAGTREVATPVTAPPRSPPPPDLPAYAEAPRQPAVAMPPALAAASSEPVIPLETLKQAIEEGRLVFHLMPIVTLPQRKIFGYDLVPRLALEEGEFADPPDFMPRRGGEPVVRRIERLALEEAIAIARRARTNAEPTSLFVPLSRASLVDAPTIDKVQALFEANRAVVGGIALAVAELDWTAMPVSEKAALAAFVGKGVKLSLRNCRSLRLDFATLAGNGVRSVSVDAPRFLASSESFTDFHTADIKDYIRRFEIDLVAGGIHTEEQVLMLLEDGITLAQGPHIAVPGPARADLSGGSVATQRVPSRADA
jgi:cyclic-di-GMP phosphodiesterase TipF (flagellum assembly factor)